MTHINNLVYLIYDFIYFHIMSKLIFSVILLLSISSFYAEEAQLSIAEPPKELNVITSCSEFRNKWEANGGLKFCTKEYVATCGWLDRELTNCINCFNTYSNPCMACADDNVVGYTIGECPKIEEDDDEDDDDDDNDNGKDDVPKRRYCKDTDRKKKCKNKKCRDKKQFFCANLNLRCIYGECTSYYRSKCEACSDKYVNSTSKGLCPQDKELEDHPVYFCKASDRTKFCTEQYIGVCAVTEGGLREVGTICQGCQNSDVIAVYDAKCPKRK